MYYFRSGIYICYKSLLIFYQSNIMADCFLINLFSFLRCESKINRLSLENFKNVYFVNYTIRYNEIIKFTLIYFVKINNFIISLEINVFMY